jgi:hypothetical protein
MQDVVASCKALSKAGCQGVIRRVLGAKFTANVRTVSSAQVRSGCAPNDALRLLYSPNGGVCCA